jgi:hypothetical protein
MATCAGGGSSFENVSALVAELRAADLGCEHLTRPDVEADGPGLPSSSGVCSVNGEGVQIFVFSSKEDADLWFKRGRMESVPTARGSNWVVVSQSEDVADEVSSALNN